MGSDGEVDGSVETPQQTQTHIHTRIQRFADPRHRERICWECDADGNTSCRLTPEATLSGLYLFDFILENLTNDI